MKDAGSPAPLLFCSAGYPGQKRIGLDVMTLWSGVKRFRAGEEHHGVQHSEYGRSHIPFLGGFHALDLGPGSVHGLIADNRQESGLNEAVGKKLPGAGDTCHQDVGKHEAKARAEGAGKFDHEGAAVPHAVLVDECARAKNATVGVEDISDGNKRDGCFCDHHNIPPLISPEDRITFSTVLLFRPEKRKPPRLGTWRGGLIASTEELTRREDAPGAWCATVPRFNKGAANFAPSDPGQVPGIFQHLGCCLCPANRLDEAREVVWRPGLSGCVRRTPRGEVPEWLNGAVSKTVVGASPPRVRIPLSPPLPLIYIILQVFS